MKNKTKKSPKRILCDPSEVESFDYSKLSKDFDEMSKPAKRALINSGILTPAKLKKVGLEEVLKLHGMGKSSLPILKKILKKTK